VWLECCEVVVVMLLVLLSTAAAAAAAAAQARGYVGKSDRSLVPSPLGRVLSSYLILLLP